MGNLYCCSIVLYIHPLIHRVERRDFQEGERGSLHLRFRSTPRFRGGEGEFWYRAGALRFFLSFFLALRFRIAVFLGVRRSMGST